MSEPRRDDFDNWDDYITAKELYDYYQEEEFWASMREQDGANPDSDFCSCDLDRITQQVRAALKEPLTSDKKSTE